MTDYDDYDSDYDEYDNALVIENASGMMKCQIICLMT